MDGLLGGQYGSLALTGQNAAPAGMSLVRDRRIRLLQWIQHQMNHTSRGNPWRGAPQNVNTPISYFYCMNIQTGQYQFLEPRQDL